MGNDLVPAPKQFSAEYLENCEKQAPQLFYKLKNWDINADTEREILEFSSESNINAVVAALYIVKHAPKEISDSGQLMILSMAKEKLYCFMATEIFSEQNYYQSNSNSCHGVLSFTNAKEYMSELANLNFSDDDYSGMGHIYRILDFLRSNEEIHKTFSEVVSELETLAASQQHDKGMDGYTP